jgi:hypothetical protein
MCIAANSINADTVCLNIMCSNSHSGFRHLRAMDRRNHAPWIEEDKASPRSDLPEETPSRSMRARKGNAPRQYFAYLLRESADTHDA